MSDDEPCPHGWPEELCDDCYAYWKAAGERFADDDDDNPDLINIDEKKLSYPWVASAVPGAVHVRTEDLSPTDSD